MILPDGYVVFSDGSVWSNRRKVPRPLSPFKSKSGYLYVDCGSKFRGAVHRIVAAKFCPNPENLPQVNHKNNDKTDNRAENLEWVSQHQNMRHCAKQGRVAGFYGKQRLVPSVDLDALIAEKGICYVAEDYGVCYQTVWRYKKKREEMGDKQIRKD